MSLWNKVPDELVWGSTNDQESAAKARAYINMLFAEHLGHPTTVEAALERARQEQAWLEAKRAENPHYCGPVFSSDALRDLYRNDPWWASVSKRVKESK